MPLPYNYIVYKEKELTEYEPADYIELGFPKGEIYVLNQWTYYDKILNEPVGKGYEKLIETWKNLKDKLNDLDIIVSYDKEDVFLIALLKNRKILSFVQVCEFFNANFEHLKMETKKEGKILLAPFQEQNYEGINVSV